MQQYSESNVFWAGDGRFCGDFPPFCVFEIRNQTCHHFDGTFELHFFYYSQDASLKLINHLATLISTSYKAFMKPFYTIGTPL